MLLGQFGDWGAYTGAPGGKKVCFALAKPTTAVTEPAGRKRDPSYAFVSTRPAEKVRNEVSMIVGYPQKPGVDATATIGSASYVMYTQNDGAWVKNAAEEAQMVETMRKGADLVVKSVSTHGTKTTDTYSLKGLGRGARQGGAGVQIEARRTLVAPPMPLARGHDDLEPMTTTIETAPASRPSSKRRRSSAMSRRKSRRWSA